MSRARYVMIGGFLGAGKTTSINRLARLLTEQGLRVGLITNDQGTGLTDSAIGRAAQYAVEEIAGGCFCCRFSSLVDAAVRLTERERPDVFLAEPVGSCTDLAATVSLPLQQIYGSTYQISPLSVVVDPLRARAVLGLDSGKNFSPNVLYIYRKQLEEAELLVINKCDLLTPGSLTELRQALATTFPDAEQFVISARDGTGVEAWFAAVMEREMDIRRVMDVDYELYADGEALLGWLNLAVELNGEDEWDGNAVLRDLAGALRAAAEAEGSEIAHLKMTLTPPGDPLELAAVNCVATTRQPELSHHLAEPLDDGELLVNLRAEADPDALDRAARTALASVCERHGLTCRIAHSQHFRPGKPEPTHRIATPREHGTPARE